MFAYFPDGKQALVSARLGKQLRESGCTGYDEYLKQVETDQTGESLIALIDALTTNSTSFLRESSHFDRLKQILPSLASRSSSGPTTRPPCRCSSCPASPPTPW